MRNDETSDAQAMEELLGEIDSNLESGQVPEVNSVNMDGCLSSSSGGTSH